MHLLGLKPFNILLVLEREQRAAAAQAAAAPAAAVPAPAPASVFNGAAGPSNWGNRRYLPSLKDIENIVEQLRREARMHPNDVAAVGALVTSLMVGSPGSVLYYHPQVLAGLGAAAGHEWRLQRGWGGGSMGGCTMVGRLVGGLQHGDKVPSALPTLMCR
jgi:hypothetical protein